MFLHCNAIAPQPPFLRLAVDGSLGGRNLPEKLPQFEPRALFGGQERNPGLFGVVSHEDRYEQGQNKDGSQQIEDNKEEPVGRRGKILRLLVRPYDTHDAPLYIDPAFLRNDLEKDEEGVGKIVKIEVWVGNSPWSEHVPIVRRALILSNAVAEITLWRITVVALHQFSIEQVESIYGEGNEEAHGDKCGLGRRQLEILGSLSNSSSQLTEITFHPPTMMTE